jgi:hypothetical protein
MGFDSIPFMIAWFMLQDWSLQFGSLNYAADDIINSETAFPESHCRTFGGHAKGDEMTDPGHFTY